ncbi:hypothetical protein D3C71_1410500 [compost metagenome]
MKLDFLIIFISAADAYCAPDPLLSSTFNLTNFAFCVENVAVFSDLSFFQVPFATGVKLSPSELTSMVNFVTIPFQSLSCLGK